MTFLTAKYIVAFFQLIAKCNIYCQHYSGVLYQQLRRSWIVSALRRIHVSVYIEYSAVVRYLAVFWGFKYVPCFTCGFWVRSCPLSPQIFRMFGQVRKDHCWSLSATYYHSMPPRFCCRGLKFWNSSNLLLLEKNTQSFKSYDTLDAQREECAEAHNAEEFEATFSICWKIQVI